MPAMRKSVFEVISPSIFLITIRMSKDTTPATHTNPTLSRAAIKKMTANPVQQDILATCWYMGQN
jgi:hypothetical protein